MIRRLALAALVPLLVACQTPEPDNPPPVPRPAVTSQTPSPPTVSTPTPVEPTPMVTMVWSLARWPNVADHAADAQFASESPVCTLERDGADDRRQESLAGIPTLVGHDRDEYPPASCAEGGFGADVRHVPSTENRSHGAWWGNAVEAYPDGTVLLIVVQ